VTGVRPAGTVEQAAKATAHLGGEAGGGARRKKQNHNKKKKK